MQIQPPELMPYDKDRYMNDLSYRLLVDLDDIGERHQRLLHLLKLAPYPNDYVQSQGSSES